MTVFSPDSCLRGIEAIIKDSGLGVRRQRGRIFRSLMSGLERARCLGLAVREMVLTLKRGVADSARFARWFQTLRKRIEHKFRFRLEYCMVIVDDERFSNRVHAHILFTVRSLVSGVFLGLKSGFVPFGWLREAWFSITKHSYGVYVKALKNNPRRLANYFVAQYFGGQFGRLRLTYSWNWVFRGFCRVWRERFALRYANACIAGSAEAKNLIIRSWHRVLGMDWHKLVRLFPFLKPDYFIGRFG